MKNKLVFLTPLFCAACLMVSCASSPVAQLNQTLKKMDDKGKGGRPTSEIVFKNTDSMGSYMVIMFNERTGEKLHPGVLDPGKSTTVRVTNGTWYVAGLGKTYVIHADDNRSVFLLSNLGLGLGESRTESIEYLARAKERVNALDASIEAAGKALNAGLGGTLKGDAAIAVFPITADNAEESSLILEGISVFLANSQKYTVIEKQKIDELLAEQDFQQSGYVDASTMVSIGKLLEADAVIFGTVNGEGASKKLFLWVIDVSSTKMLAKFSSSL
jgi:hypothetical protein